MALEGCRQFLTKAGSPLEAALSPELQRKSAPAPAGLVTPFWLSPKDLGLAISESLPHLSEKLPSADTAAPGEELHLLGFVIRSRLIIIVCHHHVHQSEAPTQVCGSLGGAHTAVFCEGMPTVPQYGTAGMASTRDCQSRFRRFPEMWSWTAACR